MKTKLLLTLFALFCVMGGATKAWAGELHVNSFAGLPWIYNPGTGHGISYSGATMTYNGPNWYVYNAKSDLTGTCLSNDDDQLTLSFTVNASDLDVVATIALYNQSGAVVIGSSYKKNNKIYLGTTNETGSAVSRGYAFEETNNSDFVANITTDADGRMSFGTPARAALSVQRTANQDYHLTFTVVKRDGHFVGTLKYGETDTQDVDLGETFSINGISITFDGWYNVQIKDWSLDIKYSVEQAAVEALQTKITEVLTPIEANTVGYPAADSEAGVALKNNREVTAANYATALAAYNAVLASDEVNLPVDGKAYTISANYDGGTDKLYYDATADRIRGAENPADNYIWLCKQVADGKYLFINKLGKFLIWGSSSGFDNVHYKAYTDMYSELADITIAKANANTNGTGTASIEQRFGCLTIQGLRNGTQDLWYSNYIHNHQTNTFVESSASQTWYDNGGNYRTHMYVFEEVAGVTSETEGYRNGVEKYTLYTTAKANNETYAEGFGEGPGKYHFTDKNGEAQISGYMDAVKACTTLAEERSVVNSIALNLPDANKFYTFRHEGSIGQESSNTHPYTWLTSTLSQTQFDDDNNRMTLSHNENPGKESIFFYNGSNLIAYDGGLYANANTTNATAYAWSIEAENNSTAYHLKNGSSYLTYWGYDGNANKKTGNYTFMAATRESWAAWYIAEVTSLPIKMNEVSGAYYGTINLPVAVTLPAGLKAYSAVANGDVLNLTKVAGEDEAPAVLAANTPVILYAERNVAELTISNEDGVGAQNNDLQGTTAAIAVTSGENCVLSGKNGNVGFYLYNNTTMPGFKAYLPTPTSNVHEFRFVFEEDIVDAIRAIESENSGLEIYNLAGQKVSKAEKGIYIVNGKKVSFK